MSSAGFAALVRQELPRQLEELWIRAYSAASPQARIVAVVLDAFTYLFDEAAERNVAVYGIMGGKNLLPRDHARMAGFPKAEGKEYHRGHMIPHSGHGGTDINLFIQKGSVNTGPFRELEKLAIAHPGSLYFVRLLYAPTSRSQRPVSVEQGLFLNTVPAKLETRWFPN